MCAYNRLYTVSKYLTDVSETDHVTMCAVTNVSHLGQRKIQPTVQYYLKSEVQTQNQTH